MSKRIIEIKSVGEAKFAEGARQIFASAFEKVRQLGHECIREDGLKGDQLIRIMRELLASYHQTSQDFGKED